MATLKHGLSGLRAGPLVGKSRHIENEMDGNPHFPTPTPTLQEVSDKRRELEDAISRAATGDKTSISIRNGVHGELESMLKLLAKYVDLTAAGREDVILSSGFEVASNKTAPGTVTRPSDLSVVRSESAGEVKATWKTVKYGKSYIVEVTTTDPALPETKWEKVGFPTRTSYTHENLTPGTYYWYRVRTVGSVNMSGYSDVALIMAA